MNHNKSIHEQAPEFEQIAELVQTYQSALFEMATAGYDPLDLEKELDKANTSLGTMVEVDGSFYDINLYLTDRFSKNPMVMTQIERLMVKTSNSSHKALKRVEIIPDGVPPIALIEHNRGPSRSTVRHDSDVTTVADAQVLLGMFADVNEQTGATTPKYRVIDKDEALDLRNKNLTFIRQELGELSVAPSNLPGFENDTLAPLEIKRPSRRKRAAERARKIGNGVFKGMMSDTTKNTHWQ